MPSNGNHTLPLLNTAKHMLVLHIFELLLADCVTLIMLLMIYKHMFLLVQQM